MAAPRMWQSGVSCVSPFCPANQPFDSVQAMQLIFGYPVDKTIGPRATHLQEARLTLDRATRFFLSVCTIGPCAAELKSRPDGN